MSLAHGRNTMGEIRRDKSVQGGTMCSRPKADHPRRRPSRPSDGRSQPRGQSDAIIPTELYRAPCTDAEGNRYTVIAWRFYPVPQSTFYTLDTGGLVNYVDERTFEIDRTGVILSRLP